MQRSTNIDDLIDKLAHSALSPQQIKNAKKTLGCLNYIRNHLDLIARAVDDRDNLSFYQQPGDREKGVLRDDQGTSFHIEGFKNGAQARESLLRYIEYIEGLLQKLTDPQRMVFASRLQYDEDRGCLPKRLGAAVNYAEEVVGDRITLNSIMNYAAQIARRQQLPLCATAVRYYQENAITHAVYNDHKILLSEAVILHYIADVLCESANYIPAAEDPVAQFKHLCDEYKPNIVMGRRGMVQCHFTSKEAGDAFAEQVKQLDVLQGSGIENARCKQEVLEGQERYILRLTQVQYALVKIPDQVKIQSDSTDLAPVAPLTMTRAPIAQPVFSPEDQAKATVLSIETAICQKQQWTRLNLFRKKSTSALPTRTASDILKLIREARYSNEPDTWQRVCVKVYKKLNASHCLRDADTQAFYDSLKSRKPLN